MNDSGMGANALECAALNALGIGAWEWDLIRDRIHWSAVVHRMFGLDSLGFSGGFSEVVELIHPEDRERFRAELRRVRAQGSDWDLIHRVNISGHERWVHGRGRVERDASRRALKIVGIIEDVTLSRALNAEHSEQTELMQAALDASLFAVTVLDTSGQIIYSNQLAASLLGLTRSEAETRAYDAPQFKHTDVSGAAWPAEKQPFVQVLRTGAAVFGVEHRIERPDGQVVTLRVNCAPIKNERGEVKLVVCSFQDISEQRATEESVRQTQKLEAIGRLAGAVAHDFNNLLTAILSYAALARGELANPARVLQNLDGITEAGERAAQLTRQLLAFGRRDISQPIHFDARSEVTKAVRLITRTMGNQITSELHLDEQPCFVHMDPNQLQQVLLNLAVNARDAMPEGGTLRISVERTAHSTVRLRVSDTGHGMDEATQRRAFEPFFTTKPAHEGTGLGLSTCHGIIVQAGGQIRLHSVLGRGTRVDIELPLMLVPEIRKPLQKILGRDKRILVVEDDPSVRRIAVLTLQRAGYEVRAAADASQALALLTEQSADLIVCDMVLPGTSGPDLIERLRKTREGVRVLFVSGYSDELSRTGSDPFLAKPYAPEALRGRVAEILAA